MYEHVPEELTKLNQWVCWKAVPDDSRPGKVKKIPVNPKTGGQAMVTNPDTWASFEKAVAESGKFSGIGFMFAGGYFGVDIDNAGDAMEDYAKGGMDNIAAEFIHTLESYAEYSVSGKGIHILCRGTLPKGGRRRGNVEMYDSARFFVVTGKIASAYTGIADGSEAIRHLHEKYIGGGQAPTTGMVKAPPSSLSEADILLLAGKSKQGSTFCDLYAGRWGTHYHSQSEADMALCVMLAFWTGKDMAMMDRLFRASGLMRDKWDRRQSGSTYGAQTLGKAVRFCQGTYQKQAEYSIHIGKEHGGRFSVFHHDTAIDIDGIEKHREPSPVFADEHREPSPVPSVFYTFDDTGNARRFTDRFGDSILYNYTAKKWMYYDGRCWVYDESGETKRMADEVIEQMRCGLKDYLDALPQEADRTKAERNYVRHMKASRSSKSKASMLTESQHRVPVGTAALDKNPSLLNVLNGELNLKTGILQPHDRKNLMAKIARTEYRGKAEHRLWDRFLMDIFHGDQALIHYIQKAVGYCLTGSTQEHCAFFLYGTGRNGKSTFLDILSEVMGDYAVNIQPETIMQKLSSGGPTSDIARLKGARFVTCSEPGEGARLNEGLLKQMTGGDKVTACAKYENEFEFTPEFKLWMCTNHKPCIRGTDTGIWSRIHLIPFDVQIEPGKMDRQLKFKLRRELPGILHWAAQGCLMWQREGLKPPESVLDAIREYRTEMDSLASFIGECCDLGGEAAAGELFQAYLSWAKSGNEYQMSSTMFGREMAKRYQRRKSSALLYIGLHLR